MKAGSLYYHFASKEELAAEVLRIGVERVHQAVEARLRMLGESASLRDKIEGAIAAHLETLWQESDFASAHIRCIHTAPAERAGEPPPSPARLRDGVAQFDRRSGQRLIAAAGGEPNAVRLAILGALNWSLEWSDPGRHKPEEFARTLATSFIRDR